MWLARCLEKEPGVAVLSSPRELLADLRGRAAGPRGGSRNCGHAPQPGRAASVEALKDSDIFINCALIDDQPFSSDQRGWVSQFQRQLEVRLEQLWGEPVKIGRYLTPAGELRRSAMNSSPSCRRPIKTMISVVSPPFLKAEGCRREVAVSVGMRTDQGGLWYEEKARIAQGFVKTPVGNARCPCRYRRSSMSRGL